MFKRPRTAAAMYLMADGSADADATQHESFHDAQEEATLALEDTTKRNEMMQSALAIANQLGPDLYDLIEMAEMHWKDVRRLSSTDIFILFCCLAYIANPMDAIPDAIAGIGLSDDMAVLAMTVHQLRGSIQEYKKWKMDNLDIYQRGKEEVECKGPAIGGMTMCTIL
mmetsp:Transcript_23033/g.47951  ORF Transcript_23033/g.47951 Transcript_23033/m.47951 type:complete len:168 (-) Transcript_23033:323-826(-)